MLVVHVTEAAGSHCLRGGTEEKLWWGAREVMDLQFGQTAVCVTKKTRDGLNDLSTRGQQHQLSSEFHCRPEHAPPRPHKDSHMIHLKTKCHCWLFTGTYRLKSS